jgi:DNA-binding transcriptional LysR family regulator
MFEWSDARVFLAVCARRSLAEAAKDLAMHPTTVGRRLAALEAALGAKLFRRGPTGLTPTRAGEEALAIAEQMAEVAHRLEGRIDGRDRAAEGFVRLTMSESFARAFLAPRLAAFFQRHPRIELSIKTDNRVLSLSRREADVALRNFRPDQPSLVTRKIARVAFAPYASPSYVSQRRGGPDAYLGFEDELALLPDADWPPERRGRAYALGSNSRAVLESAAAGGLGVAVLPCYLGDGRADLVRVGAPSAALVRDLWLVVSEEQKDLARVRAVVDFVVEQVASAEDVLLGRVKPGARRRG